MDNYIELAIKTESNDFEKIKERLSDEKTIRLLHAAMGMVTESGEFLDALKKNIFYGRPIDEVNLIEESGDLFWYLAIFANTVGLENFNQIMELNIAKLKHRYAGKFGETRAENRDLDGERKILEG